MKYGIIVYKGNHGNTVKRQGKALFNLGDCMQMLAIRRIYKEEMGISDEDIVEIDFHDLHDYDGEYVVLPINLFFFGCGDKRKTWFPASPKIIPVFIGVHFDTTFFTEEQVQYLRQWAPIGCRDYFTLQNMRRHHIPAYLFGCVTATFPQREQTPQNGRVFLVDVPESLLPYIPDALRERSETITQEWEEEFSTDLFPRMYRDTERLLQRYKEEAALIVTSRLHCASPCMALGIPTILVAKERSSRFAWIEKALHIYLPEEYPAIDWDPKAPDYAEQKRRMVSLVVQRLRQAFDHWEAVCGLSEYWEASVDPRNYRDPLDRFFEKLPSIFQKEEQPYILWGLTCHADEIYQHIKQQYPQARLVAVVDEYENKPFYGMRPVRSDAIRQFPGVPLIITPTSAKRYVEERASRDPSWGARLYMSGELCR